MINLTIKDFTVQCPNTWEDDDAEKVIDQIEDALNAAEEALRNKLKEINAELYLKVSS